MVLRQKLLDGISATALTVSLAVVLPGAALAQETSDAADATVQQDEDGVSDAIVITGFRQSLETAAARKREATSIVEVIAAEDIGKLPDSSIAEALSRLPGLATQRFDGRASKLSVRGLAPDFTMTTLNGREMVSSDNNRAVEFDQFPSELLSGAVVYKTPDAELTSQAIGGTVDLQTIRPLSQSGRTVAIGVRGEINDNGKLNPDTNDKGYRANITYIDQNDDGTIGWALGYARMVQPIQEQYIHVWGFDETTIDGQTGLFVNGVKPYVKSNELTRDGFMATLEFEPTMDLNIAIDGFYSKFDDDQTLRGQEIAGYTASSREILAVENGVVTQGRWNGIRTMSRNDFSDRNSENLALGFNARYQATDTLGIEFDASYSQAERTFAAYETYSSTGRGQTGLSDTITYTLGGPNGMSVTSGLDYADPDLWALGDNLGWGGPLCSPDDGWSRCNSQDGFVNTETSDDDLTSLKLAAEKELNGGIRAINVGLKYSMRNKDHTREGNFLTLNAYPALVEVPSSNLVAPANLGFLGIGDTFSYDARALVASGIYFLSPENRAAAATNTWTVQEDIVNAYVMADLDTMLGNTELTGNIGVQVVYTDQSSQGTAAYNEGGVIDLQDIDQGDTYWDVLPSMNLIFGVTDNTKIRLGAAKVLARARMDQMNASRNFGFNPLNATATEIEDSPWSGGGGNPMLRPWEAWQLDVSVEHYFGGGGYIAVAPFYKHLSNYIYDSRVLADFSGIDAPGPVQPVLDQGFISAPDNGDGGKIYGLELTASVPFGAFVPALEGFGVIGSTSFTRSEVRRFEGDEPQQLPGLSRNVYNGTIYYERGGFGARLSARHRSKFLAESFAIGLSRETTIAKAETILDAQVSYDLTGVGVKGLTLYLQGSNLTDEPFIQYYNDDPTQFRHWHTYGRNFMAGATFKF